MRVGGDGSDPQDVFVFRQDIGRGQGAVGRPVLESADVVLVIKGFPPRNGLSREDVLLLVVVAVLAEGLEKGLVV